MIERRHRYNVNSSELCNFSSALIQSNSLIQQHNTNNTININVSQKNHIRQRNVSSNHGIQGKRILRRIREYDPNLKQCIHQSKTKFTSLYKLTKNQTISRNILIAIFITIMNLSNGFEFPISSCFHPPVSFNTDHHIRKNKSFLNAKKITNKSKMDMDMDINMDINMEDANIQTRTEKQKKKNKNKMKEKPNKSSPNETTKSKSSTNERENELHTYTGRFLEDNGLTLITDETGRVTAIPSSKYQKLYNSTTSDTVNDSQSTENLAYNDDNEDTEFGASTNAVMEQSAPKIKPGNGFNVVLTHCTADFDSLASAVGLAKLWSSPHSTDSKNDQDDESHFDSYDTQALPTFVVLPRGAHPSVQRFLALHKHLFPIKSLKSLPSDLSTLNRVGLVDAQRRDRVGPAEHLLSFAKHVTVVDHHIDSDSDIPEATDYIVDKVGSVSTLIVESLISTQVGNHITEAEATLLALGIHADTGSLCFDSTTARDAKALGWLMEMGASQAAIAEHSKGSLSTEQQGVLTQALLNMNSTNVHGVTVSTVLLSAEGFINGLAAVTQDALELSGSDVLLLSVVYNPRQGSSKKRKPSDGAMHNLLAAQPIKGGESVLPSKSDYIMQAEAWKGGEEALKRRRWKAAFDKKDIDSSGYLDKSEIASALASSGVIASNDLLTSVMEEIDTNNDGKIDFEEFVEFASRTEELRKEQEKKSGKRASTMIIIGRCKAGVNLKSINLNKLFQQFGGGGHAKAASATKRLEDEGEAGFILQNLVDEMIETSLMEQPTVGDFMTAPVLSAKPDMTEKQVEDLFVRYDVRALPVVDDNNDVVGLVTYKEVAAAKQRLWNKKQKYLKRQAENKKNGIDEPKKNNYDGKYEEQKEKRKLGSALKGWMKQHVRLVEAGMTMMEVEAVLLENDVGCIPVVMDGTKQLVGMVTRTDLLRQHRYYETLHYHNKGFSDSIAARKPIIELRKRLKKFDLDE